MTLLSLSCLSNGYFILQEIDPSILEAIIAHRRQEARGEKKLSPEQADIKRKKLWITIAKKEIPKVILVLRRIGPQMICL